MNMIDNDNAAAKGNLRREIARLQKRSMKAIKDGDVRDAYPLILHRKELEADLEQYIALDKRA